MRKTFFAFPIFLIASVFSVQAQSNTVTLREDKTFFSDFVVKNWTTSDGLPGMTINELMQDNKGYLYIASYDGLVRFDGVEFTVINRTVNEKYDFASARSLLQDSDGNLWVGHNDEGITCLSDDGSIKKYTVEDGIPNNKINAVCEDKNKNIWIGTASGLCYKTLDDKIVIPDGISELSLENILVDQLYCDSKGRIWILTGTANDLFVYDGKKVTRYEGITKFPNPSVRAIYEDKNGDFWFGVGPKTVVKISHGEEIVYDISSDFSQNGTNVSSIEEDSAGNIWIGTENSGLAVIHDGKISFHSKATGLPDDVITRLIEDTEKNIWIGTNRGGLVKLSKGKFSSINMDTSVNAICDDTVRNVMWLATDQGISCYKDNTFVENAVTEFCKGRRVRHVGITNDGELLISTYSDATQIVVYPDDTIKFWTKDDGFLDIKSRVAIKVSNGDYYVGATSGLYIIHHGDESITRLSRDDGFENHYIMWLFENDDGKVWAGTNGGGVYVLENEKIIKHYNSDMGLAGNVIFKIAKIDGNIWIGTGTGLSRYIAENDSFVNFNSTNGLGSDSVFQLMCDYNRDAWMTTNKGVLSVPFDDMEEVVKGNIKRLDATYYGESDGLITSGVTSTSLSIIDSKGRVWFTLTDGFAIYDPAKSEKNLFAPKIDIQEYSIDNEKYEYHGEKIVMPPSAKRLSIKYTGLSFISSDSMKFRFKLDGFDDDYSQWSNSRQVSYTNLRHGTYNFTLQSMNSDEVTSEPSTPLVIIKKPYFWQLPWFWAIIIFLVAAIIALMVLNKIRKMRRYQKKLEQKVDERTRELKVANEKAESLLLNILPAEVAAELTEHPDRTIAKKYHNATVLFTDIVGFTKMSGVMSAEKVVTMLNRLVSKFDERAKKEGIEKIKTIGDAYMAATGLNENEENGGAEKMIRFAQGLIKDVGEFNETWGVDIQIRVGINSGELVAGVIGKSKFIYDIWGDTVNVASRMESTGVPMQIHVSEATFEQTKTSFSYGDPVEVAVKGKGDMKTYFI